MKLFELLKKANKEDVLNYLKGVDDEKYIEKYSEMYDKLLQMTPTYNNDLKIYLVVQKDYFDESNRIDVLGFRKGDKEHYALDFMPWSDWLGSEIVDYSLEIFGETIFIAECLAEMSFISFDENRIQSELQQLNETSEKIKNGVEETYTWEEVVEHLNEKFDMGLTVHEKTIEEEEKDCKKMKEILKFNEENREKILSRE